MADEPDPWSVLQTFLHPASGAPAVELTLEPGVDGAVIVGAGSRVGAVAVKEAANDHHPS